MPSKFIEGVYPIYLEKSFGCYVATDDGYQFIDYPLGLGAILLGYSYLPITVALVRQLVKGNIFTLPSIQETILAQKLKKLIPSCEMVRFLKTGSEATSAAVRIARAYTSKEHIACCGYHGWHDWYTATTPKAKGIPKATGSCVHKFEYNNIDSLKTIFENNKNKVACVILEPCIFEEPKDNFLKKVIELAHKNGAIVIFDEVVTGFRFPGFSAQKFYKVKPDMTTLGKAMGNGIPISCVCGKREIMKELEGNCFVSSTFGGDLLGIIAALETIRILETEDVLGHIWYIGQYLKDGYNEIAKSLDLDTSCVGYPNRTMHLFPTSAHKSLFWQECIRRGILFGYAQFISYSHQQKDIDYTLYVVKEALKVLKENWKDPIKALDGKPAEEVFRLLANKE